MGKNKYNEKGYRGYIISNISNLFKNGKYSDVIRLSTKYLKQVPNEQNVLFMRAKSYRNLGMFDEAIKDFKTNLNFEYDSYSMFELYYLYYFLNKYEEAIELLPILYKEGIIKAYSLSISELVMKTQLGIDMKVKKIDKHDYIKSQILDYNDDLAIEHIKEHLNPNVEDSSKSYFNNNLDLEYLYWLIRNSINNENKVNIDEILEAHYFAISKIGFHNGNACNYLKVVVVPNTNKIITMYPINDVGNGYIAPLDIDYDKLFKKETCKVKRISQIDKFNKKYNM